MPGGRASPRAVVVLAPFSPAGNRVGDEGVLRASGVGAGLPPHPNPSPPWGEGLCGVPVVSVLGSVVVRSLVRRARIEVVVQQLLGRVRAARWKGFRWQARLLAGEVQGILVSSQDGLRNDGLEPR